MTQEATSEALTRRPLPTPRDDGHRTSPWLGAPKVRELWEYREVLYYLIWRDIKVKYRQP